MQRPRGWRRLGIAEGPNSRETLAAGARRVGRALGVRSAWWGGEAHWVELRGLLE